MSINISYLECFHIFGYSDSHIIIYQSWEFNEIMTENIKKTQNNTTKSW